MGNKSGKEESEDRKKKKQPRLTCKDTLALFIAAIESLLLPLIIFAVIMFIVALLLFVIFPSH
jgi:uncharacterized protein YqhQ